MYRNLEESVVDIPEEESVNIELTKQENETTSAPDERELEFLLLLLALKNLQHQPSSSLLGSILEQTAPENDILLFREKFVHLDGFTVEQKKNNMPLHLKSLVYQHSSLNVVSFGGPMITASKIRYGNDFCCFPTSASAFQEINFATMGDELPFLTAKLPTLNICPCCKTHERTVDIFSAHLPDQVGNLQISGHIRHNAVLENKLSNEKFTIQMANTNSDHSENGPAIKIVNQRTGELVAVAQAIGGVERRTYRNGRYTGSEYNWNKFQLIYLGGGLSGVDKALFLMAICVWVVEMKEEYNQVNCFTGICGCSFLILIILLFVLFGYIRLQ